MPSPVNGAVPLREGATILIVHDFYRENPPLPGGGQTEMNNIIPHLQQKGYEVVLMHPYEKKPSGKDFYKRIPYPTEPEFAMALTTPWSVRERIRRIAPDAIFNSSLTGIAGTLGLFTRSAFKQEPLKVPQTYSYTTRVDMNVDSRIEFITRGLIKGLPRAFWERSIRRTYSGNTVLVPTQRMGDRLISAGVPQEEIVIWKRGTDTTVFRPPFPGEKNVFETYEWYQREPPEKIFLYFGRVSPEKNIETFLRLDAGNAHKVVIGEGEMRGRLQAQFPEVHFLGAKYGEDLARHVRFADLFVFPSTTDTWGLVVNEAAASGTPVVAFDVAGPGDAIIAGATGILVPQGGDLGSAIDSALALDRAICAQSVRENFPTWSQVTEQLVKNLHQINPATWQER